MVVILCDSFYDAEDAYRSYVDFLELYDPWLIAKTYDVCNCILTTEDIYYIFVDARVQTISKWSFDPSRNDFVDEGTFFDNLYKQYQLDCFI